MTTPDKELVQREAEFAKFKEDYARPNNRDDIGEVYFWACYWHERYHSVTKPTTPAEPVSEDEANNG